MGEAVALHNEFRFEIKRRSAGRQVPYLSGHRAHPHRGAEHQSWHDRRVDAFAGCRQGRASNGVSSGIELIRFMASPRATLVEERRFDPSDLVPGVSMRRRTT